MAQILVVDDDEIFRFYLVTILKQAEHTVLEASDGRMGLDLFVSSPVDLIITDIFMPRMDGIDLLAALLCGWPCAKVIAISGGYKALNAFLSLEMAKSFGAIDIITKPFRADTVLQKIANALQSTSVEINGEPGTMETVSEYQELSNLQKLIEMKQELAGGFVTVIRHYQDGVLRRPERIRQALLEKNAKQVAMESHSLKSVCRQIGLVRMGELAARLEAVGVSGSLEQAEPLIEQLVVASIVATHELTSFCSGFDPPRPFFAKESHSVHS
nr:similar to regulator protein PilR [uncultured bacterium]